MTSTTSASTTSTSSSTTSTLATGGLVLSVAMLVASGANYGINAILGRWLEPQAFADASLIVTLFLLLTVGAVALQLMASRRVAASPTESGPDASIRWLRRQAWTVGSGAAFLLTAGAPLWQHVFNTSSAAPFALLAVGLPFYLAQAVDRGVLQGHLRFTTLAISFLAEAGVRMLATAALVAIGAGSSGVAAALSASFAVTWLLGRHQVERSAANVEIDPADRATLLGHARPVAVLLVAQILINNADVLIVKAWLPDDAATYSAVALIGRAVFFLSWSVVNVLFPVSAQDGDSGSTRVDAAGVAVVLVSGSVMTVGAALWGEQVLTSVVGPGYGEAAHLLWRYALATTAFTVANLLGSLDLARGRSTGPKLIAAGAGAQTLALVLSASSIGAIVDAQLLTMTALVTVVGGERLLRGRSTLHAVPDAPDGADGTGAIAAVDLLAQVGDVDVDDVVVAEPVLAPHALA